LRALNLSKQAEFHSNGLFVGSRLTRSKALSDYHLERRWR
jgi:hypothetical protein